MTNEVEIGGKATGMAFIGSITEVNPIENADKIEQISVYAGNEGTWDAVARIGEFKAGDKCEIYLQDSLLPSDDERFAFMAPRKFRVRMVRLRGVPSEALVMPIQDFYTTGRLKIGTDITEATGVKKYEKPIPTEMKGQVEGGFPVFIPRTRETNFQRVPKLVAIMNGDFFYISEKADGTSCTAYHNDGHYAVCSRNYEIKREWKNFRWQLATQYGMEEALPLMGNMAVQFEAVGPGIQKNTMGLPEKDIRVFDIYDIDRHTYLDGTELAAICERYGWPMAPITICEPKVRTKDDWLRMAEGEYPNGHNREGIVVRPLEEQMVGQQRLSFKVLNLDYKG